MKTINLIKIFILGLALFSTTTLQPGIPAQAAEDVSLDEFLQSADLVVEGVVLTQLARSEREIPGYISGNSVKLKFGSVQDSIVQILRPYKGEAAPDQNIHVFSYPQLKIDVSNLKLNKQYILFLKKHPFKNGYYIVEYGKGAWQIFSYNGKTKLKSWDQYPALRSEDAYLDYESFRLKLEQKMAGTK